MPGNRSHLLAIHMCPRVSDFIDISLSFCRWQLYLSECSLSACLQATSVFVWSQSFSFSAGYRHILRPNSFFMSTRFKVYLSLLNLSVCPQTKQIYLTARRLQAFFFVCPQVTSTFFRPQSLWMFAGCKNIFLSTDLLSVHRLQVYMSVHR